MILLKIILYLIPVTQVLLIGTLGALSIFSKQSDFLAYGKLEKYTRKK